MSAETATSTSESRKPKETRFKQQRLPAWQPVMSAHTVLPVLFAVGIGFIPLGIGFLISALNVQEVIVDYTKEGCNPNCGELLENLTSTCFGNCTEVLKETQCQCNVTFTVERAFETQVYMYYGLDGYYQNLRRYVKSRDDYQLNGKKLSLKDVESTCKPLSGVGDPKKDGKPYIPCGVIANSLFTDKFTLYYVEEDGNKLKVPLTSRGISWSPDFHHKYNNPEGFNMSTANEDYMTPPLWTKPFTEMLPEGFKTEDFLVWMRTAALPNFRKLYRRVVHDNSTSKLFTKGLPAGNYTVMVDYNYPVTQFDGKKRIILTTTSFLGGKNPFLGIAYLVVGTTFIIVGFILFIVHLRVGKSSTGVREEELSSKTPYYDLRLSDELSEY